MHISPEDFYSDTPPPRIIGTECEYSVQNRGSQDEYPINPSSYIASGVRQADGFTRYESYLDNGGRICLDVNHIEYDSPECLGPRQAAAADMAGIVVVQKIISATNNVPHHGVFRFTGSFLPDKKPETNGYHENYLVPRSLTRSNSGSLFDVVIPSFLASQTWAMSGGLRERFVLSQKVWGIGGEPIVRSQTRRTEVGQKPMCMVPTAGDDHDVINDPSWARVERRYADAGLSPAARYLGMATMSLTLRLLEHAKKIGPGRLAKLGIPEPAWTAKTFAADVSQKVTVETYGGRAYTALDLQEEFALFAKELDEKIQLPDDEHAAVRLWLDIIDKYRMSDPARGEYHDSLIRLLDAPARHHYLLQHFPAKRLSVNNAEAASRSLLWDRVLPTGGGLLWWGSHPSRLVTSGEIQALVHDPPPQTRAAVRSHIIRSVHHNDIEKMDWASVTYYRYGSITLVNPYGSVSEIERY